ncbi:hypothetical protein BGZ70_007422 [Mortierella alpina]|uniref:Uncharacterized protein n=1 Tax=Mortierella alpina TaxID=64518 RepID=A0A9P6J5V6_MORAP|nr:hypothetical protein BGZ70_007422 [Mortierella alpina]
MQPPLLLLGMLQGPESFYKSAVMSELQSSPAATSQDRKKMLGILDRFEKQAVEEEQLLELSDEELLSRTQRKKAVTGSVNNVDHPETSSKSSMGAPATLRKLTALERDELIREAIEEEERMVKDDGQIDPEDKEEMERMMEQEYQSFVSRFAGVDLDHESFESIWARLNPEEQREFSEKFMVSKSADLDDQDQDEDDENTGSTTMDVDGQELGTSHEEELEAKSLLHDMGETLKQGGAHVGNTGQGDPMLADLDPEDLRAIRDAEIAELVTVWRPWWEIEAEESGQLKKVVVSKVPDGEDSERLGTASAVVNEVLEASSTPRRADNIPKQAPTSSTVVLEQFVLDEETMLRPHKGLVQSMDDVEQETKLLSKSREQLTMPPMVKPPHPSLIYHICGLLFSYAALCRVLNGDLKEEPELTLSYVVEICPFFAPPPPTTSSSTLGRTSAGMATADSQHVPDVQDFETTLAVLQRCSLDSRLWKGDTVRLDMLSLLLRDLTLVLARPSRCLRCIQELKEVFALLRGPSYQGPKRQGRYTKSMLHRLYKKLEFYESYLLSEEWIMNSDTLDRVRTEVVIAGIRVRQEMIGWTQELKNVSRLLPGQDSSRSAEAGLARNSLQSTKKVLIEELP